MNFDPTIFFTWHVIGFSLAKINQNSICLLKHVQEMDVLEKAQKTSKIDASFHKIVSRFAPTLFT